jgi:hypothetical protein
VPNRSWSKLTILSIVIVRTLKLPRVTEMLNFIRFTRRENQNGTVDSVCIMCQKIIATGGSIIDLVPSEIAHTCDTVQIILSKRKEMHRAESKI